MTAVAETYVSVKRIEKFLLLPESKSMAVKNVDKCKEDDALFLKKSSERISSNGIHYPPKRTTSGQKGIVFDNVTATWSDSDDNAIGM